MERFPKKYSPEEVFNHIQYKQCDRVLMNQEQIHVAQFSFRDDRKLKSCFDGHVMKLTSSRLRTFSIRGLKCSGCDIVGSIFYKERSLSHANYHFNLYGYDKQGREVLMTKDHVRPRSKGGQNHINNYQTMCAHCNREKGSRYEE